MGRYTEEILRNAERINKLKSNIDATYKDRDKNPKKRQEWLEACSVFHSEYEKLAFPGGFDGAYERLLEGDPETMEAAICFLECRPYFFRSGYMFKALLKKAKRAPLPEDLKTRLNDVILSYDSYKKRRKDKL